MHTRAHTHAHVHTETPPPHVYLSLVCVYHVEQVSCLPSYLLKCSYRNVILFFFFCRVLLGFCVHVSIHSAYVCEAAVQNTPAAFVLTLTALSIQEGLAS